MPAAPYNPVPDQQAEAIPAPRPQVGVSGDAFGTNVAQASEQLGRTTQQVGDELFTRAIALQQLRNEADARDAQTLYAQQSSELHAQFQATKGKAAVDGLTPTLQQDAAIRKQVGSTLTSPMARKMFDADSASFMQRNMFSAASHAATENKSYLDTSIEGKIDSQIQYAQQNYHDDVAFNQALKSIQSGYAQKGDIYGWNSDKTNFETAKKVSELYSARLKGMALTNPFQARGYYESIKGNLVGNDVITMPEMLDKAEAGLGSREISHQLTSGDYISRLSQVESGNQPFVKAQTSNAQGLYQFTPGTWQTVREANPDLGLPVSVANATPQQQTAAVQALTSSNRAALEKAGVETDDPHLYLAHFLGADGAVKFSQGLSTDPNQPAINLVGPAEATANKSIFYNPDGTPRTAASTFIRLTAPFMGSGQFTAASTGKDLQRNLQAGKAIAQEISPNNPYLEDAVASRVKTAYDGYHSAIVQAERSGLAQLQSVVNPTNGPAVKSMEDLENNPSAIQVYNGLPATFQQQIRNQIEKNAKQDIPMTPERQSRFVQFMGGLKNPASRQQYMLQDPTTLDLPQKQTAQLQAERSKVLGEMETSQHLLHAIQINRGLMKASNIISGSPEEDSFWGAMDERIQSYQKLHDKAPDDAMLKDWGHDLLDLKGGSWYTLYWGQKAGMSVDQDFQKEFTAIAEKATGKTPNARQLSWAYQYSLEHPNWREELRPKNAE